MHNEFCIRKTRIDFIDNSFNALNRFVSWLSFALASVVCPDHQNGHFRREVIEGPMLDSPEDVFGSIAAKTEVERIVSTKRIGPNTFVPAMCDRVADEE